MCVCILPVTGMIKDPTSSLVAVENIGGHCFSTLDSQEDLS